ncbi:response regulator transcription factor [Paenibacillus thalictri]|uniref:Response regulator transcription factor n=1 Tax=Paenibacillus thalictri TaxID=2527873 RepID=A0A4Q9DMU1_9BACL|nr:response regulator transcription factor [Paenibacillus thalictri]TBL76652.1 response regulator transcription factor [Paenibacillus thalictri]
MRILLVEDDARLGFMIQYKLAAGGYQVDWAQNSEEAEDFLAAGTFDLYILDWMLPGKTGLELCKQRRERQDKTAILMLTARDAVEDRVNGLMQGADDYLVKPFAFEELFARIIALDRRKQSAGYEPIYTLGDLSLNPLTQEVIRGGAPIQLTKRELQLLTYLMRHPGEILSRERILNYVWGSSADVTSNAVDAIVKLLRKKLDDPFDVKMLHNVHGQGYRLTDSQDEPHD